MRHEIIIGKYTLESLTNGMYASPMDLYREYIQNAVDSFDEENKKKQVEFEKMLLDITVNKENKEIVFEDNGGGISSEIAAATLTDIGNSGKNRTCNRGFRGIGRLAGLGYCSELVFITSCEGENKKTIVSFNAKLLGQLLLSTDDSSVSVSDVMQQIMDIKVEREQAEKHYFKVILQGISNAEELLDVEKVKRYLIQHAPVPYGEEFKWKSLIISKFKILGYEIPQYRIILNGEELFKPYKDSFVSDRVKKNIDTIKEIEVVPFYNQGKLVAVLWNAVTNCYGTILDNEIKGIRIRQGNILVGDRTSCNSMFKEERFNGWLIGEIFVLDDNLIVNSRRDNFEKNKAYYDLVELISEWAKLKSKEIRHISYERSLSVEKKAVIDAEESQDINDLWTEDVDFSIENGESDFIDYSESEAVAETDFIGKLTKMLDHRKIQTKYTALNINSNLTGEEKKVLERVFDIIKVEYRKKDAEKFINLIASEYRG